MRKNLFFLAIVSTLGVATMTLADEPGPAVPKPQIPDTGVRIYQDVCQACHMADGKGASGAATIPALAANPAMASA